MTRIVWLLLLFTGIPVISGWTLILSPTEERLQNRRSGDNFLVVCKVKDFDGAASDVKIVWYRDGKLIPRFGSTMTIERTYSNQLMINRPKISDGGRYTCKSEVNGEQQEVSAEISFVDPPRFVNAQEQQHPEEGTRAEIICEVEGTDQLEVFWQFNGVTLDETSQRGYEFSENNQILYIPHFTAKKDDGIYNCNAAQFSSFETLSVNVTGYVRPTITVFDVPNGNRGIEGHTIELKCGAVGKPKPTYKWFFEDDEVPIARSDKHNVEEGLLIIESLNSEDAGTYKCIANNTVGSNERSFDLAVFLKPKVELKHEHVVKEGEDLEIICGYHGEGQTSVKFVSGSREFAVKPEEPGKSVSEEIQPSEDSEESTTTEDSSSDNSSTREELELNSSLEKVDEEENHASHQDQKDEEEKEEEKKWKRFADDVNSERISVREGENKLILKIKNITLEDAADYTCAVTNEAGTTNKITQVGIIHPPTLRHYTGSHVRSFNGNTVSIYCDVSAVPSPKWQWYKDGKEVEANGASIKIDSQASSTKLTLENFEGNENFGVYTCKADNGVGELEKQINVIKVVKPETPTGMDCKKIIYPNYGKCSFDSEVYQKEESKPQSIELLLAKLEEMESDYNWNHAHSISFPFEEDTITVINLAPNTQYVVKARAVNEAGNSEYTEEISLETTDPSAPQSPASVDIRCSEYCTVSWDTPNDHGSPLLKYKITIQEMQKITDSESQEKKNQEPESQEKEESEAAALDNDSESEDHDDKNQTNEKTDDENEAETSDISKESSIEMKNDSGEETILLNSDSAEILPTDASASAENRGEMIPHGSLIVYDVDATENHMQLPNIKPHSYYKITVAAENAIGQGEPAEIEHQTDDSPSKYDDGIDSSHLIIAITVGVLFLLLLIDFGCFLTNRCGLISCICLNLCGYMRISFCLNLCGKNSEGKQRDLESGRGGPESNRLLDSSGAR